MNEQTPTPNMGPVVPPAAPQPAPVAVPAVPAAPVAQPTPAAPVAQPPPVAQAPVMQAAPQAPVQAPVAPRPASTAPVVRPPAAPGTRPMRTVVVVKKKRVGWLTGVVIVLLATLSWFYVQRLNDLEAAQKLIDDAARQAAAAEELLKNREKPAPTLNAEQKKLIAQTLGTLRLKAQTDAWLAVDFGSGKKPDFTVWQAKRDEVNKKMNAALAERSASLAAEYGVKMEDVVTAQRTTPFDASAQLTDAVQKSAQEAIGKGLGLLVTGDAASFASAFEQFALSAELQDATGTAFVAKLSPYLTKTEVQKLTTSAKNLAKAVRGEPVVQTPVRTYAKRAPAAVQAEPALPPPAQDGSWITAGNTWLAMPEKPKPVEHAAAPEQPEEFKGHTLPTEKKGIDQTAITPANKRSIRAGEEWYDGAEPLHSASGPQCPCDE